MKEIALNILDIVENSVRAGSKNVWITFRESRKENIINVSIRDDGPGIPSVMLDRVTDPFCTSRTTRKTGLGISLLQQQARAAGGGIKIESHEGEGTHIQAWFKRDHFDRQPIGDLTGTLKILYRIDRVDFFFTYSTDYGEYSLSTPEIKKCLGVSSLNDQPLLNELTGMIRYNLEELLAGT